MFDFIKQQTTANHSSLEKFFLAEIRKFSNANDYAKFLSRLFTFYTPMEGQIHRYVNEGILDDINERRSATWILDDLMTLQCNQGSQNFAEISFINSLSEAIGALYVIEGSTHGGPYIAKMISNNLSLPAPAFKYFNGYNNHTASKWDRFKAAVSQQEHRIDAHLMANAANQTFLALHNWLKNNSPEK